VGRVRLGRIGVGLTLPCLQSRRHIGESRPAFSFAARCLVAGAVAGGSTALALALVELVREGPLSDAQLATLGVVGLLLGANWAWPLRVSVGSQTRAVAFDEYALIVLVLLVPPGAVLATFASATVLAQGFRRRPLVKSAFNVGQVLLAAGAGALVFHVVAPHGGVLAHHGLKLAERNPAFYWALASATLAAVVYTLVNGGAVIAILAATGTAWRTALCNGVDVPFLAMSLLLAPATAVVVAADPWLLALAVAPPLILRRLLADRFQARRERLRVKGLFEATLQANRSMGESEVTAAVLCAARELLRTPEADLSEASLTGAGLRSRLALPERDLWLSVPAGQRTEPFDDSDQALLDALAAVGTGALSNAWLFEEIRYQRESLSAITSSMGEGVVALSSSYETTFVNPAACAMLGWPAVGATAEARASWADGSGTVLGRRAPGFLVMPARRCMDGHGTVTGYDARFERLDGSFFHVAFTASPMVHEGRTCGAVVVFRDISERKEFEEQLARHAFHDSLTGLPNRRLFLDHLDLALNRSTRSGDVHAVLFADVDRFKLINDSLGHTAGDHLLVAIAHRIRASLRPGDVVARFGGDEFTVLLQQIRSPEEAVVVADRILEQMRRSVILPDGHEVVASLSIGVALTVPGKTRDDMLHDADVAMYRLKGKGRGGQFEIFDADAMGVRSTERIDLENGLRRALHEHELEVHYQPLFSVADRRIVGAEALVRWNHPERGMLSPQSFIGLAEETGLILALGHQVLEDACRQARRWYEQFGIRLVVGVNLSARQFQQAGLLQEIEEVLHATGVAPTQLSLEITESLAMEDVDRSREILLGLKALGVRVAIDDFGTGYSALGYLAQFPVNVVKIDRSFVQNVEVDPVKSAIVAAVIKLSSAIGTTTVVEGVETREQLEHLEALGCPEAQGFYLARPMPADKLDGLLEAATSAVRPSAPRSAELSAGAGAVTA